MRPLFPFYGSKWNIARHYPAPLHPHVVEPFAGSAGYSLFYECPKVTLVDADPVIVGVWDYLLKVQPKELLALPELPNVGDNVDDFALPQEARWLIGFWLNRGSAQPKKSRTAYSARTDRAQLNWGRRAKERIAASLPALHEKDWRVFLGSAFDSFALSREDVLFNAETTWFVDPPYADKGKFYSKRLDANGYADLGRECRRLMGQVIVCEGPGATWLPFKPLGDFKSTKGRATEVIWTG